LYVPVALLFIYIFAVYQTTVSNKHHINLPFMMTMLKRTKGKIRLYFVTPKHRLDFSTYFIEVIYSDIHNIDSRTGKTLVLKIKLVYY